MAHFVGRDKTVLFDAPFVVVSFNKLLYRLPYLFKVLVDSAVDDLFLEGSKKALCNAVGLRLMDEGTAGSDSPVFDLVLEVIAGIGRAVMVTQ